MAFVWFCAISALIVALIRLYGRVKELETRLTRLSLESGTAAQVADLRRRLEWLERLEHWRAESPAALAADREHVEPETAETSATAAFHVAAASMGGVEFAPPTDSIEIAPPLERQPAQRVEASPPVFASAPRPTLRPQSLAFGERVRRFFSDDEWETLVGGSVLNRAGAVVLVIGIALFLAYSWTHMSAAGRAFLSFSLSLLLLGAGIWTERRAREDTVNRSSRWE